jgi:hypothetical protein
LHRISRDQEELGAALDGMHGASPVVRLSFGTVFGRLGL